MDDGCTWVKKQQKIETCITWMMGHMGKKKRRDLYCMDDG